MSDELDFTTRPEEGKACVTCMHMVLTGRGGGICRVGAAKCLETRGLYGLWEPAPAVKAKDKDLLEAYLSGKEAGEAIAERKMGAELAQLRITVGDLTRKLVENKLL